MGYAPSEILAERHRRLRQTLADRELDALVVTWVPNVFYLTNFDGSSAVVLLTRETLHFVTDFRYVAAVEAAWATPFGCPGAVLERVDTNYDDTLVNLIKATGVRRVGFEAARVPFAQHGRWASAPGVAFVPTERAVEAERVRKDAHEVATLREAADMLSVAFGRIAAEVRPGRTEREVAALVDFLLKDTGFERTAFDTIVASGPNGALPHARPGTRELAAGDLVVLDFGGVHDGYCVDLTRTLSIGDPDAQARRVHEAVLQAHGAGVEASRAGATAREIDRAARGTLERLGLGDAFGHGTGHGLGVEIHEEPWLRRTPAMPSTGEGTDAVAQPPAADVVIETGMVFTIEPGAYLPGWGGVRVEDDILVTAAGPEVLTHVPRELTVV